MKLCILGKHKPRLVHTRIANVGNFEWYECENCDKKLFTVDNNFWGNDKWKNNWHKTPEEDKLMYNSDGKIRKEYMDLWYKKMDSKKMDSKFNV